MKTVIDLFIAGIIGILSFLALTLFGFTLGKDYVESHCRDYGSFVIKGVKYECKKETRNDVRS